MSEEQLLALTELEDLSKEELISIIRYAVTLVNELRGNEPRWEFPWSE